MPISYLAAPYSDQDPAVTEERIQRLCEVDQQLMLSGVFTVSPLYKHMMFMHGVDLPGDWNYWRDYSLSLLPLCERLIVIQMPGWDSSTGVTAEIAYATDCGIPICYIDPNLPVCDQLKD